MPNVDHQPVDVMQIVKSMRRYEHMIHRDVLLYRGGDTSVARQLVWDIRCYKAIKEEMTTGVYELPPELQWFLDLNPEDGTQEVTV